MRNPALLLVISGLVLTGCATLSPADRDVLRQHRVSPQLYATMLHRERLSLADIIELAERRVPASFTIRYLRSTWAVYSLGSDDVVTLKRAGVNRQVIDYLMTTPALFAPRYEPFWYHDDPFWWGYSAPLIGVRHHHHRHCD